MARVKSMLRIKALHDTVAGAGGASRGAGGRARRVEPHARAARRRAARRARARQAASGASSPRSSPTSSSPRAARSSLESHRREVTVVFCDLRGFTAFAETAEPEEVMAVLRAYHEAMGELIFRHEGTLERFAGDGLMVFFNDPVPCPDPAGARRADGGRDAGACRGARSRVAEARLPSSNSASGSRSGYATLGQIGFEGRFDYGAIGTVTNLAARLCDAARGGQILVEPARLRGGGRTGGGRARRRARPQGVSQTHAGLQRRTAHAMTTLESI